MYKQGFAVNKNYIVGKKERPTSQGLISTAPQLQTYWNAKHFFLIPEYTQNILP